MASIQNRVTRTVVALDDTACCAEAARLMTERGIGSVGVRRGGVLAGLVTERDLVAAIARGVDPTEAPLAVVLRPDFPAVAPQATDAECAHLMRARRTRHLAVREGGALVGVISMLDLVDLVVEEKQSDIEQLESYIRGGRAHQLSEPITTLFSHAANTAY
jgi:CBS domain-containing protein